MGKIFVIIGKSATGKDSIYQEICIQLGKQLVKAVSYTTRPIRDKEANGREYFFVGEAEYQQLKQKDKIIEERAYQTVHGIWRYFTVNDGQFDDVNKNYILILTLEAYEKIKLFFGENRVYPIYIEVETGERLERALKREKKQENPKYTELCRRFLADEQDFSEELIVQSNIKKRYYNDNMEKCIEKIIEDIKKEI